MLSRAKATISVVLGFVIWSGIGAGAANARPMLLMETSSGKVLYSEDQDDQWYPASLTKILTSYIVFEDLKSGRLKPTDLLTMSEDAHKEPPSKLGLPVGGEITVEQAVRILIVKSANDVAIMLAEKIGGSIDNFAKRMNATARRLGMRNSNFVNPNGLPDARQWTTARDLAHLARHMMLDFPRYQSLWGEKEVHYGKLVLRSHNGLLKKYEGADGIKTGFICDSGFNIVASATRDGRQLI
ncbi:MAG: D-alanyl-D-alanine carboxypeptidase family protein, partial [Hyphomicrobiaceae bacterium]